MNTFPKVSVWLISSLILHLGFISRTGAATWITNGPLTSPRYSHTATLLLVGTVLITGGTTNGFDGMTDTELYDPTTGKCSFTGSLLSNRQVHAATLLTNGAVLVAGGFGDGLPRQRRIIPATDTKVDWHWITNHSPL